MEKRILKAAIIGCGAISKNHVMALAEGDYAKIVALCDIDIARAEERAEVATEAALYTDWRVMLDEAKPDVVHICTPHYLHAEMACECLERGINVYLEKPVAISHEELCHLEDVAAKSKAKITVSFQNRRIAPNHLFISLVEAEGGAKAARGMVTWNRGEDYYTADDWHGVLAREGGGLMINQAIHNLDMLLCAFPDDEIVSVRGNSDLWYNAPFSEVEDNANFIVTFASGKRIVFFGTNDYATTAPIFYEVTTASGKRITGMDGKIFKNGEKMEFLEEDLKMDGKNCWGYGHRICIREFYEAIVNDTEVPVSLATAARTMRVIFALYRSHGKDFYLTDL